MPPLQPATGRNSYGDTHLRFPRSHRTDTQAIDIVSRLDINELENGCWAVSCQLWALYPFPYIHLFVTSCSTALGGGSGMRGSEPKQERRDTVRRLRGQRRVMCA